MGVEMPQFVTKHKNYLPPDDYPNKSPRMQSVPVKAFLSHQFTPEVQPLLELVKSICVGLDIAFENVNHPSSQVPVKEAKTLIENSHLTIALCTRDKKFDGENEYSVSPAVQQEITMAFDQGKPVAMFVEDGVSVRGFYPNMVTFSKISYRGGITPALVEVLVKGIHREKVKAISDSEISILQESSASLIVEHVEMEIELCSAPPHPTWKYTLERKFRFIGDYLRPIKAGVWSLCPCDQGECAPEGNVEIIDSSRRFQLTKSVVKTKNSGLDFNLSLEPFPRAQDWIAFREVFSSPGLNPIYLHNCIGNDLAVRDRKFSAVDGYCCIHRTRSLSIRYVFPAKYPLELEGVTPVVGTFSSGIDHVIEREIERVLASKLFVKRAFNSRLEISMAVKEPLYQHFYGIAWNPPDRAQCSIEVSK